jgi:type VI secretion system protein ImpK
MHLTDCFLEWIAYVVYFRKTVSTKQPPFEQVRTDLHRLIAQSEESVEKGDSTREDFDQARFAVCAWTDETILASNWEQKNKWQREQLQRVFYNTTEAGEEFFERLNQLGPHQKQVREVYYLCLALGFKGRYFKEGDDFMLDQLKTSNLKFLLGTGALPSLDQEALFPESYPKEKAQIAPPTRKWGLSMPTVIGIAAPLLLFGLLFFIYYLTLGSIGENILKNIP